MEGFKWRGGNFAYGPSAFGTNPIKDGYPRICFSSPKDHRKQEILHVFRVYDHKEKLMVYSNKTTDGSGCFYFWTLEPVLCCTAHRFYESDMNYTKEVIPGIMFQVGSDSKAKPIFTEDILEFDDLSFDGLMIRNTCRIVLNKDNFKLSLVDFKTPTGMKASDFLEDPFVRDTREILYDCEVIGNKYEGFYSEEK